MSVVRSLGQITLSDSDDEDDMIRNEPVPAGPARLSQTPLKPVITSQAEVGSDPIRARSSSSTNRQTDSDEMIDLTLADESDDELAIQPASPSGHSPAQAQPSTASHPSPAFAPAAHPPIDTTHHSPTASTSKLPLSHSHSSAPSSTSGSLAHGDNRSSSGADWLEIDDDGDEADLEPDNFGSHPETANTALLGELPEADVDVKGKGREVRSTQADGDAPPPQAGPTPRSVTRATKPAGRPKRKAAAALEQGHYDDRKGRRHAKMSKTDSSGPKAAKKPSPAAAAGRKLDERREHMITVEPFVSQDHMWSHKSKDIFLSGQLALPPQQRVLCGPQLPGEFADDADMLEYFYIYEQSQKRLNHGRVNKMPYTKVCENMINQANQREGFNHATIRIIPQPGNYLHRSPPFEFHYTNRVVYAGPFLPLKPEGCGCVGDCADPRNIGGCECRKRQEEGSTTRRGGESRSGQKGFAYDKEGRLRSAGMDGDEPVFECNSECGCGPECHNRVVGNRVSLPVDIFHTPHQGWAVRNPPSYEKDYQKGIFRSHKGRTIRRGEPLGIYSGELITTAKSDKRSDLYDKIGRNYDFALDAWTIAEDCGYLTEDSHHERTVSITETTTQGGHEITREETYTVSHSVKTPAKGQGKGHTNTKLDKQKADKSAYTTEFTIDAFHYGNWTRFCNHKCNTRNAAPKAVYIDDRDPRRPLWVFFATRDIQPGEEITIAYHDNVLRLNLDGMSKKEIKDQIRKGNKTRAQIEPRLKCFCGDVLCDGVMMGAFDPAAGSDEDEDDGADEENEAEAEAESDDEAEFRAAMARHQGVVELEADVELRTEAQAEAEAGDGVEEGQSDEYEALAEMAIELPPEPEAAEEAPLAPPSPAPEPAVADAEAGADVKPELTMLGRMEAGPAPARQGEVEVITIEDSDSE